jgi:predicted LPLAT superfamily acyltransferase
MQYDEKAVEFFKTLPKYHYDSSRKEWSFPTDVLDKIITYLGENDGVFMIVDSRQSSVISIEPGKLQLKLAYHVQNFERFKALKGFSYNKENRVVECDESELGKVKQYLQEEDIVYHVNTSEAIKEASEEEVDVE